MQALWLQDQTLSLRQIPQPELRPGEALVRVTRAGICNTDLELLAGYYPYDGVLGHEFVGRVEEGPAELLGQRVVGEINAVCGSCRFCRAGIPTHCADRSVLGIVRHDGAFAQFLRLPAVNLHTVPDSVSDDVATFTEPLAAALEIQEQVPIGAGQRVLVVGTGKLGQLIARSLRLTGCDLVALGRREQSLELLRTQAITTITSDELEDRSFDIAVECTGNPAGFELARRALVPRGTLLMKSTYHGQLTLDAAAVVVDELTLVGSRCGPFVPALERLASREVVVEDLIEATYDLADILEAFEHAARPGALKVLVSPN
ncbi:MAG: alcohol dehydrogenase catalytic domain-containing protein [Thermoanaerobaculia bacterium]|nr:alcohol dehydrogenase catalytic domain-containing protein [Thermoanaerobaculia bacterium]